LELIFGKKVSNKARRGEARLVSAATVGGSQGGCGGVGNRRGEVMERVCGRLEEVQKDSRYDSAVIVRCNEQIRAC
jgi:hypothetical protein